MDTHSTEINSDQVLQALTSDGRAAASNLVDVWNSQKKTTLTLILVALTTTAVALTAQTTGSATQTSQVAAGPPPSSVPVFPLNQVHRGLKGVAWTVFEGTVPEPMDVEILGVLRGGRGPGQDMILARLRGPKPEYTGVVAGMSGSPVYIDGKLLGSLSYRIGQFSKDPIAGITPIEQMLEIRDIPEQGSPLQTAVNGKITDSNLASGMTTNASTGTTTAIDTGMTFAAMETPLLMSGFDPEAIRVWKERMAGTGLDVISAGGPMGSTSSGGSAEQADTTDDSGPVLPGSAVSMQLVRGDLEIAATCTVTYIDPKQLLACGHPVLQAGPVSLPMTSAEVVATLASPLNAFKIVNTGRTIGAFTQDRGAAIRGELGAKARMIPVNITVDGGPKEPARSLEHRIEVADLPSMTASLVLVSVYQVLLQTNQSTVSTSYHVTGEIGLRGMAPVPVNTWAAPADSMQSQLAAALAVGDDFTRLYANASRLQPVESVNLHIEAIPQDLRTELESVRLVSSGIVHAGGTVELEATIRPWQKPARNVRMSVAIPARLQPGTLRLLVGSAAALDRTLDATRSAGHPASLEAASARLHSLHDAAHLYAALLLPESQASVEGQTLESLPLSMANSMEAEHSGQDVELHGESIFVAAEAPIGGVLNGQQIVTLHVEAGGGLR
ncbi:SpoIVB peptidase S55 [Acidicapsa ligni]|uniref:SpoIVB peptidase S55 n=1 Tax=Acidicapsa ligni TaxID=542300 RepID=UPI0021DF4F8A|nr:SpoIVB peptidase S55 [Acidicapsa ligni]